MKTLKKIVLWALVIGICIIIIGVAGLYIFFPKETVKQMAIDEISSTLNRKVTIDNISMSLWGGLGAYLGEIKIANADGFPEDNILSAEALDIKLQFWPLLKKEIKVDRLILERPVIFLRKTSDGTVNYRFGAIDSVAREAGLPDDMPDESKLAVSAVSFALLYYRLCHLWIGRASVPPDQRSPSCAHMFPRVLVDRPDLPEPARRLDCRAALCRDTDPHREHRMGFGSARYARNVVGMRVAAVLRNGAATRRAPAVHLLLDMFCRSASLA